MADNFNINTTQDQANEAGGLERDNPSMTYVDFANQMATNSQNQARQAQLVQQAIEQTKQQRLATTQGQEAADLGVNPNLKEILTVTQAVALLKAAGIDDAQIQAFVDAMGDNQTVSKVAVDTVIRKKEMANKPGTSFIASGDDAKNPSLVTKEGDQLVEGQSYYDTGEKDDEGNGIYGHGGKEPMDNSGKLALNQSESAEKQWQKMGALIQSAMKSRSGPVGMLGTTIVRSLRALNTLNHGKLTKQDVSNVSSDIAAIYQGGVPSIIQTTENNYGTKLQDLAETLRHYTGILSYFGNDKIMADTSAKLRQVLEDMRNSAVVQMQKFVEMQFPFFQQIIDTNPERWEKVQKSVLDFLTAGELSPTGEAMPPSGAPATTVTAPTTASVPGTVPPPASSVPDIHALASALGLKKKAE